MNTYDLLEEEFFKMIENKVYGTYKQKAYKHSIEVKTLCMLIGKKMGLDVEACAIMGLYHDISKYTQRVSKLHGTYSATILETLFKDYPFKYDKEVLHAITLHSNKESVDDLYSECLKDADCYASYLEEPEQVLSKVREERVKKVEELL